MSKYIKLFDTTAQYNAYTADTENFITPNVSLALDAPTSVYYKPLTSILIAKYNVTSTTDPTKIGYNAYTSGFSSIEIDGVEQPSVVSAYTFDTLGVHTVKYTLTDPTSIGECAFNRCSGLTSIDIPDSVTSIGASAFTYCTSLSSIISNRTTAPTISNNTFQNVKTGGTLTVPSGSSGYDVWMRTINYYLGKYNWTKVEQ